MRSRRRDGTNPDLKNLLLSGQVRLRLMAGHALREILDVGVVSVVESAQLAHAIVQAAATGPVLPELRLRQQQGRIIGVAALHVEGCAERYRHRAGRLLDE